MPWLLLYVLELVQFLHFIKMDNTLRSEDVFIQIRDKLQKDGIKLWLPPYFEEKTGASNKDIEVITTNFKNLIYLTYLYIHRHCHRVIVKL